MIRRQIDDSNTQGRLHVSRLISEREFLARLELGAIDAAYIHRLNTPPGMIGRLLRARKIKTVWVQGLYGQLDNSGDAVAAARNAIRCYALAEPETE